MKKFAYLICFGIIVGALGCAKAAVESYKVEGSWIFRDAAANVLVERTLTLNGGAFEETNRENGVYTLSEGGAYRINQSGNTVEIVLEGTNARVYSGKIASAGLMIEKINGSVLNPPVFYKKS